MAAIILGNNQDEPISYNNPIELPVTELPIPNVVVLDDVTLINTGNSTSVNGGIIRIADLSSGDSIVSNLFYEYNDVIYRAVTNHIFTGTFNSSNFIPQGARIEFQTFTITNDNTDTLILTTSNVGKILNLFVNGIEYLETVDYTLSGTGNKTITFNEALPYEDGEITYVEVNVLPDSNVGFGGTSGGSGTTDHTLLTHLDYASSGHTGFEPAKGTDDNYVTNAEKVKLSNLSGINTGDQILPPSVYPNPVTYSSTIDLSHPFNTSQIQLTGNVTFTPDTTDAVENYVHRLNIDLNGYTASFSGFTLWDENTGPDTTSGKVNTIIFFQIGGIYYYNWFAAYTGTISDLTPPTLSSIFIDTVTQIAATIHSTSDEASTFYWSCLPNNYNWGSATEIQKRTTIMNGSGSLDYGNVSLSAGVSGSDIISGLSYTTAYDVYYFAKDASNNYSTVSLVEFTTIDRTQVSTPVVTVTAASQTALNISVNANLYGVELYMSTTSGGTFNLYQTLSSGVTSANQLTGLSQGTTRYFKAKALGNGTTTIDSNLSVEYSGTTASVVQLSTPTNFIATAASQSQINLSWTDVSNESSYLIEVSDNGSTGWTTLTNPAANATSASQTGLSSGTTKYYRIKAIGDGTNYSDSGYAYANATTSNLTQLSTPTIGTITVVSSTALTIPWTDIANESSYQLEYSLNGTSGWTQIGGTIAANTVSYAHTGLSNGTTYYYRLKAIGNGTTYSDSNYSSVVSASTLANTAPSFSTVSMSGTAQLGQTLTGTATGYSDVDGDAAGTPNYKWQVADDSGFTTNVTDISGATNTTYVLQAAQVGKYVRFAARAVAQTGTSPGNWQYSVASSQVTSLVNSKSYYVQVDNNCLQLTDADDSIVIGGAQTISFLFKFTSGANLLSPIQRGDATTGLNGWRTYLDSSNRFTAAFSDSSSTAYRTANTVLTTNGSDGAGWHRITVVIDGAGSYTGIHIFIDGNTEATYSAGSGTITSVGTSQKTFNIGKWVNGVRNGTFKIDNLVIIDKALNSTEVGEITSNWIDYRGLSFANNIKGFWDFNDSLAPIVGNDTWTATTPNYSTDIKTY